MNIQAMLKQAQQLQKNMMSEKEKLDIEEFDETVSFVTVKMLGNRQIKSIKIAMEEIGKDEIELVEDMVLVAINNVLKKVDSETEKRMGKYTQGMPGLF